MSSDLDAITSHYLELLNLFALVLESQKGYTPDDPRLVDCQDLAIKLFFHASAIYDLRQGTELPLPAYDKPRAFFDFTSIAILARAALDAYLTLFEVFFEPISSDLFTFRHALWNLSGVVLRENIDVKPTDQVMVQNRAEARAYGQALRRTIEQTAFFQSLKPSQQKDVLRGKRLPVAFATRTKAAGFGSKHIQTFWDHHSGHTHSDGSSAAQVIGAQTKEQQLAHIQISMVLIAMVLGKSIALYCQRFEPAKAVCTANPDAFALAKQYQLMGAFLE